MDHDLALLETIFYFVLLPPLPRWVPGEGPDSEFPSEVEDFLADPGPDTGGNIFFNFILAISTDYNTRLDSPCAEARLSYLRV